MLAETDPAGFLELVAAEDAARRERARTYTRNHRARRATMIRLAQQAVSSNVTSDVVESGDVVSGDVRSDVVGSVPNSLPLEPESSALLSLKALEIAWRDEKDPVLRKDRRREFYAARAGIVQSAGA
jgi:hypothetical protein